MKIGILTLPLHTNYGGILQAYALQTVLERMGHNVVVFDKSKKRKYTQIEKALYFVHNLLSAIIHRKRCGQLLLSKIAEKEYSAYLIKARYTSEFVDEHIHRYEYQRLNDDIIKKKYDAIIVGSDQVWRPLYYGNHIEEAFLSFTKGWKIKRVAYAPSFRSVNWEYKENKTALCKELIAKFDAVSCREQSGVILCEKYLGREAKLVLDPTLLMDKDDYLSLTNEKKLFTTKTLVTYVIDSSEVKESIIKSISDSTGMLVHRTNSKAEDINTVCSIEEKIQPPVEDWLMSFSQAEMIVTDSFHACAFSIIFNKPFWVLGNPQRGMARFHSLLQQFGLESRLVNPEPNTCIDWNTPVNWSMVNKHREELKVHSLKFLVNALR